MDNQAFVQSLAARFPEGLAMDNPGGGTSTVIWCDGVRICYERGGSRLYIDVSDLYETYHHFRGRSVTTNDLKAMNPRIFDSSENGHNCHCAFFFLALQQMGVVSEIRGTGRPGAPFCVSLPS